MTALARFAVRHPRQVLTVWGVVVGILAFIGLGVEDHLKRTALVVTDSEAEHAGELQINRFGDGFDTYVLLKGPSREVARQGRELAATLDRLPRVAVLSAWNKGLGTTLRPSKDKALLVVRSKRDFDEVSRDTVPIIRRDMKRIVHSPVEGHVSGFADIAAGIHGGTIAATRKAEIIATPFLLIVLLLVFRSPIAAGIPLTIGFATIGAGSGVLEIINRFHGLDAVALNLTTMMGLALGVDYALVLVSRYREALNAGIDPDEAAFQAVTIGGRTVVFAGITLAVAMAGSMLVLPAQLLIGASLGVLIAAVLSTVAAVTALPAILGFWGTKVNAFSFGQWSGDSRIGRFALRAMRRPTLAAGLVVAFMLLLAAPALGIETGPPDTGVLPESRIEKTDYEAFKRELGEGWAAPYGVLIATHSGPITDPKRLAAVDRFERRLAHRRDVRAVIGPGQIAKATRPIHRIPAQLASAKTELDRGQHALTTLRDGLSQAGSGVDQVGAGFATAAEGARQLSGGQARAAAATTLLAGGLEGARQGGVRLQAGLATAGRGAGELVTAANKLGRGARRIRTGLASARTGAKAGKAGAEQLAAGLKTGSQNLSKLRQPAQIAAQQLGIAKDALDQMLATSKTDPQYARAYEAIITAAAAVTGRNPLTGQATTPGYDGLDKELEGASADIGKAADGATSIASGFTALDAGLAKLERGARQLGSGIGSVGDGSRTLASGLDRLERGGGGLTYGLGRLSKGGAQLAGGTRVLESGSGSLESGLRDGAAKTEPLKAGISQMDSGVATSQARTARLGKSFAGTAALGKIASSGYFTLAAVDKSGRPARDAAGFGLNVDRGGSAASLIVVPEGKSTKAGHPLRKVLHRELKPLDREIGATSLLGGAAPSLQDFDARTPDAFLRLAIVLCTLTYLVLLVVLRSLLLPLIAVLLNLVTIAAAFGVLTVLFQGHNPILGGPGFLDTLMVFAVFAVTFGLSIDYEVFLLARMREGYAITGSTEGAIEYGVRRTAGVITGAALTMTAVFIAFALTDLVNARQLGVGLTIAVLLDATLVRLILLPGAIRLCGDASWWLPRWLGRIIPEPRTAHG